jgi:hypothetical protein
VFPGAARSALARFARTATTSAALVASLTGALRAQTARATDARPDTLAAPAVAFTRGVLRLDGSLDEAAWAAADSVADFTQRDPAEGTPVSERTVVRFVGTPEGLWVGVWAYDRDPGAIRRAQLRRDADFRTDDSFTLMLSPTADKRTGFLFVVNPNGALYDAEILNFEDESAEWDGIWDARARVTPGGWQAEILIPWQTLRYARAADAWDVNLARFIRRKNETALWRAWRRSEGVRFLERAGSLRGFAVAGTALPGGLPRRAVAELRPYATTSARLADRRYAPDGSARVVAGGAFLGDAGLDAKLAPSPTLTLDLTANADFAQAEVDRQVVNLTRFPLFFPEQRPFFTEGAGIFAFGSDEETLLFYSRRIGREATGAPAPLLGGARMTGRVGGQQLGVLATHTGGDLRATDVVTRVKRDVLGRGYLGAMATLRGAAGARATPAGGLDFNLPYIVRGQNLVFRGAAAADGGPAAGDPTYGRFAVDYPNDHADVTAQVDRVGAGFVPALGFVQQAGVVRWGGRTALTPRPGALGPLAGPLRAVSVRRLEVGVPSWGYVQRLAGGMSNAYVVVQPVGAEFESGDAFELNFVREWDVPDEAFELFPGADVPAGRYGWNRAELELTASEARPVWGEVSVAAGRFYSGRSVAVEGVVRARLQPHFLVSLEYGRSTIGLAGGRDLGAPTPGADGAPPTSRFTAQAARVRVDAAASPRLNTTLFAQWDNESARMALNARVRWTTSPGSDAYLVWNSAWPSDLDGGFRGVPWRRPTGGALVAKYVRYMRR